MDNKILELKEKFVSELEKIVERLRSMSPLYEDFVKEEKKNA